MAVSRLQTDEVTRSRLGPEGLADLCANLWRIDCQSCGRRFKRWEVPALEVYADSAMAHATLHHKRCRPPGWHDSPIPMAGRPHCTWRAGAFLLAPSDMPTFLVNPSYESALLCDDGNGWRIGTLDAYIGLGFARELTPEGGTPLPALAASIDCDRISVQVGDDNKVWFSWRDVPITSATAEAVRRAGWIEVVVTTLVDVRERLTHELVRMLIGHRKTALGMARLTEFFYSPTDQRLSLADFDEDLRIEVLALVSETISRTHDFEVEHRHLVAAMALCDGNDVPVKRMDSRDRGWVAVLVASLYALGPRKGAGNLERSAGVHVITPDAATAEVYLDLFTPTCGSARSVARLGAQPSSQEGSDAYLADIVVGTIDEFIASHAFYRNAREKWEDHVGRGQLALVTFAHNRVQASDLLVTDLVRSYPRVAVV